MPVAMPMPAGVTSTNLIGKANELNFGKITEFKNNILFTTENEFISLTGFKENSLQPDPRLQLAKKASNWDKLFEGDLAGYNYLGEKLYHFGKGTYSLTSHVTAGTINFGAFKKATIFIKGFGLVNKLQFHRVIKSNILKETKKLGIVFEHLVGTNPDIVVIAGKIFLQGAKGTNLSKNIVETLIDASKYFK